LLWDDNHHVTKLDLRSLHGLWRIWFDLGATQQYYPLLHSAFWVEHRIWSDAAVGYHLTNVTLHALAACLVVMIVRRLALPGAWLAGFIFALHPVCVEAVAWISEQKSTLSGVFYLAAALTYLSFDQTRRTSRYWLALGLFVLSLLSKTVTATLPAALLLVLWWKRGRLDWRRDVLPLLPWFVVGASVGLFTAWVEKTLVGANGPDFDLSVIQRVLLAGRVMWFYAGKLVWPVNLTFTYPHWTIDPGAWWQYLFVAGVMALVIGLGLVARRHRGPLAGFLIFAGTLFPVLGFLNVYPFRYSYVADHFQYLASLGIIIPAASAVTKAAARISLAKAGRIALSAALPIVLGLLTWRQSAIYRDSETLYRETLVRNPASWMAHYNLGNALSQIPSRIPDAIAEYEATLRIRPAHAEAHNNLGDVLSQIPGRLSDAIAEYEAALRIQPHYAKTHYNLGNALSQIPGRLSDAIAEYEAAVRIRPDYAEAHNNLANALSQTPGRLSDAIAEYEAAVRIRPDYAEAHNNLGNVFSQIPGRLSDAIAEYEAAVRIRPEYAEAHYNLGNALSQIPGRLSEAVAEYQAAVRIRPDYAEAHYNLGNVLSEMPGRMPDAIAEWQAALRLSPDLQAPRQLKQRLQAAQP
jgi:tetratricopeptide (TPR) repeat protein